MKAFIIHLPSILHRKNQADYMLKTLKDYGIDADFFPGVPGNTAVKLIEESKKVLYPYSIKQLLMNKKNREKLSSPGVIGCFYSHYRLWERCVELNEPIMIFEDDVTFYRNFELVDWEEILILSLGKKSFLKDPWKSFLENPQGRPEIIEWTNFSMPGASGYAIKPNAALKLVKFYEPYWYPADNAINKSICKIQITTHIMGRNTLISEGNISMTKTKIWDKK